MFDSGIASNGDKLKSIGRVKIETTSFTTSRPTEVYEIEPILYMYASEDDKKILKDFFNVTPFKMDCISIDRIFIDKLFAIEDYYLGSQNNRLIEISKHMYDVYQLFCTQEVKEFIKNSEETDEVITAKVEEQERRREARTQGKSISQFDYFDNISNLEIRKKFDEMQSIYVFKDEFKISYDEVLKTFSIIRSLI